MSRLPENMLLGLFWITLYIKWLSAQLGLDTIIINPAGGSPCKISQGLPQAFTKSNKPPIS